MLRIGASVKTFLFIIFRKETHAATIAAKKGSSRMTSSHNNARHITTIKVFMALLAISVLSYVPPGLVASKVLPNFYFLYLYFINHVANPVAYYAINRQFRKGVNSIVKDWFKRET